MSYLQHEIELCVCVCVCVGGGGYVMTVSEIMSIEITLGYVIMQHTGSPMGIDGSSVCNLIGLHPRHLHRTHDEVYLLGVISPTARHKQRGEGVTVGL